MPDRAVCRGPGPRHRVSARAAAEEEIEALRAQPRLVVQTSPPESTPIPACFQLVNVRGLVTPGADVLVNGQAVDNVRPSGHFVHPCFLVDQPTIRVTVRHGGVERTVERTFRLLR